MGRATARFGIFLCGTVLVFAVGFFVFAFSMQRFIQVTPAEGDAIVVLTGGELRVREGFRLMANGAGRRLLISGVNRSTSKDDLRRLSGVQSILFDCCVDIGYLALDTVGNAAETRAWLRTWGFRRLVVVTSNYHMARSLMELARALPHVELIPHAVASHTYQSDEWWKHPSAIKRVLTEYVKFLPAAARWTVSLAYLQPVLPLPSGPDGELEARQRQLSGL